MLTLSTQKSITATVLILAISCTPLLAKARRYKPRKSQVSKTGIVQSPQALSQVTQRSKINVNKSSRGWGKSAIRRNVNIAPNKTASRHKQNVKRTRWRGATFTSKKPARVATKIPSRRIHRSLSPRHLLINSANRPKPNRSNIVNNTKVVNNTTIKPWRVGKRGKSHKHHPKSRKGRPPKVIYHERSHVVKHTHHYEHVYRDYRNRLCHRIVWPKYRFVVYYNWGPSFTFRYVYPYHHRKYVFISLGGYWPVEYRYVRYYWYGCHPYYWYGYYPIACEVKGDTYNYYTYNYYDDDSATSPASSTTTQGIGYVDHTTFADVRERLAQQRAEEPAPETLADKYFEEAVKAFETGDYDIAAERFGQATELAPDDMVMPFAYAQSLFAGEKYSEAAEVLRSALANISPEKEGIFYPRGLYDQEDTLFEQIDRLADKAELHSFDGDLQFLLGYQLLGIGKIDEAFGPLQQARMDFKNSDAAAILLDLLEKIRTEDVEGTKQ